MVEEPLKRFAGFESLSGSMLAQVAAHSRRFRLPAGRWLVRPGRSLSMHVYLLQGRVRLLEATRAPPAASRSPAVAGPAAPPQTRRASRCAIVEAGTPRARQAVYPGSVGVETLTRAEFLGVDPRVLGAAAEGDDESPPGVPEVDVDQSSWQQRFLTSPLMQRLDIRAWQHVLQAMRRESRGAGERVIEAGEGASCCYVLTAGRAEIRAAGRCLALLEPGSLFGEDALVSGGARNASVIMITDGAVVSLGAELFQMLLLDRVLRALPEVGDRLAVSLEARRAEAVLHLPIDEIRRARQLLAPGRRYAVVGGTWPERSLAAFLLAEQGIDAAPLAGR